ncbi:VanZ family protein [Paenibacillus sp. GP183]|uniref:VanZ family protein n=1 Tax=Paenibacillus sp. GP183 TaxID=1882751 RepID=UPI00089C5E6B|nr:VanZ family protein [Paenibacillus sp. GP183]SEC24803.1 Glycopeptide antibiotics resistance protein [Paenibacillus sp. GP183]
MARIRLLEKPQAEVKKRIRFVITFLFIGYSLLIIYWMFFDFGRALFSSTEWRYNLVPFKTIKMYIVGYHYYPFRTWAMNLFGNIAVFVPFGIFLPALFKHGKKWTTFLVLFFIPLLVLEILQTVLRRGSFDVDDLILNLLGAFIGFILYKWMYKIIPHSLF